MNRTQILILVGLFAIIIAGAALTYYIRTASIKEAQNEANKTLFSEDAAAKFLDTNSNPVTLDTYANKILVVNVWASWSPYTTTEFPILEAIGAAYKDKDVVVIGMNRKETQAQIERYQATIPQFENIKLIVDVNDFFYAGVDGYAMPETIVYDRDGKIVQHIRGHVVQTDLENILNSVLEQE